MQTAGQPSSGLFPPTLWSMVAGAGDENHAVALESLERLARAYWKPLFAFARQRGADHHQACDVVQGFFQHLLSRDVLLGIEKRETRFRSFLLTCFSNWLSNLRRAARTEQRGGRTDLLPIEELLAQEDATLATTSLTPEQTFDRRWARTLFDHALVKLDAEIAEREHRQEFFTTLRRRMIGPAAVKPDWDGVAQQFGMQTGAVRKAVHDLRQRFAALLRLEVRKLVADDADVDDELRYLVRLLTSPDQASVS